MTWTRHFHLFLKIWKLHSVGNWGIWRKYLASDLAGAERSYWVWLSIYK